MTVFFEWNFVVRMGPFINYVIHLGGRGVVIKLSSFKEGGLTEVFCNIKVYLLLTLYLDRVPYFSYFTYFNIHKNVDQSLVLCAN